MHFGEQQHSEEKQEQHTYGKEETKVNMKEHKKTDTGHGGDQEQINECGTKLTGDTGKL